MSILPREGQPPRPTRATRSASTASATAPTTRAVKLAAVAARHRVVFEALADFVAAGHGLTIVHGNHDVEFHWDAVKDQLRALLVDIASRRQGWTRDGDGEPLRVARRVRALVLLRGRRRVRRARAPVRHALLDRAHHGAALAGRSAAHRAQLLRRPPALGRATDAGHPGVRPRAHGRPRLHLARRGPRRRRRRPPPHALRRRGRRALSPATGVPPRAPLRRPRTTLREEHERRMAALALRTRVGIERLRALAALQVPPVTLSVPKIMASVLLDRIAVGLIATAALAAVALRRAGTTSGPGRSFAAIGAGWLADAPVTSRRSARCGSARSSTTTRSLVERAGTSRACFPRRSS